ncbi:hypothetical protein DFS34DRAFT_628876 [Phlyctochytrium arcticum]|nr:hypothetical protein DFS34DRAFT_628876 [Phlyctochytrium arcticum]
MTLMADHHPQDDERIPGEPLYPQVQPEAIHSSSSMRSNYKNYGVESYYESVGSTYRNLHDSSVRALVKTYLETWAMHTRAEGGGGDVWVLDVAAGSGEVSVAVREWDEGWKARGGIGRLDQGPGARKARAMAAIKASEAQHNSVNNGALASELSSSNTVSSNTPSSHLPTIRILATDPYTESAYNSRLSPNAPPLLPLSFIEISQGGIPRSPTPTFTHVIISYALHLATDDSELFALLYELSTRAQWLLVIAPGKRPEIREGWGWERWDMGRWELLGGRGEAKGSSKTKSVSEWIVDKSRAKVFRSSNYHMHTYNE